MLANEKHTSAASIFGSTLLVLFSTLLSTSGCDSGVKRVPVSGKVVIDGKPVSTGTIRFVPANGRAASSLISDDGSFHIVMKSLSNGGSEIVGLVPGKYQIDVSSTEYLGDTEDAEVRWLVPQYYGNFRTSGLEAEIQEPTDSLLIELTWKGSSDTDSDTETDVNGGAGEHASAEDNP